MKLAVTSRVGKSAKIHWQLLSLLALIAIFPIAIKTYFLTRVGIIIAIYVINITGITLVSRYAGIVSLGHAAFFALGAYLSAILTTRLGLNPWLSMAGAAGIALLFAYLFATPFLKLRLAYLAMATLGLGEVVFYLAKDLTEITGGVNGIPGIPYLRIGGLVLREDWQLFYLIWGFALFFIFFTENIGKTRLGRAYHAIRTNEIAARAMGINVQQELSKVFCFSAIVSALSGSLLAHFITFISPEFFTLYFSFSLLIIATIGGANIWGGVLTTVLLIGLSEVFRGSQDFSMGLYGILLIVSLYLFPGGLATLFLKNRLRENSFLEVKNLDNDKNSSAKTQAIKPQESRRTILEFNNISKSFDGTDALIRVSGSLRFNQILGIIGPNGAGKTTLLNVLNGFLPSQEGEIIFKNQNVTHETPYQLARLGLGRTFQISNLFKGMTVIENVMVGCHIKSRAGMFMTGMNFSCARIEEKSILNKAMESLKFIGLNDQAYTVVENLPYGDQKLVELARALAMEPDLLLLDEPAAGLNDTETEALSLILRRIKEEEIAIILVEHNMPLIMGVSDSILVLDFGQRIALGTSDEVSKNEKVIKAYLGQ